MTLRDDLAAICERRRRDLADLLEDQVRMNAAVNVIRADVIRLGRKLSITDRLANKVVKGDDYVNHGRASQDRLRERSLRDFVSTFERYIGDTAKTWLTARPRELLGAKGVTLEVLLKADTLDEARQQAVEAAADERVLKLMMGTASSWFTFVADHLGINIEQVRQAAFIEVKEVRNALEHSAGIIGRQYIKKVSDASGNLRYAKGDRIDVDVRYHQDVYDLIDGLMIDIAEAAADKATAVTI